VTVYSTDTAYLDMPLTESETRRYIDEQRPRVNSIMASKPAGRILDIGCGSGFFLVCAKEHNWDTYGTEVSEAAIGYARDILGLNVYEGNLESLELQEGFFVVVTIYHTLEHVGNPKRLLLAVRRVMKDKGLLVIEVPNAASFEAHYQGKKWEGWALPVHFFHFSPQSLRMLLERCGFLMLKMEFSTSSILSHQRMGFLRTAIPAHWLGRLFSGTSMTAYALKGVVPTPLWALPSKALRLLSEEGAAASWREAKSYVRWRASCR